MHSRDHLHECYRALAREAERLAGGLGDLAQRATVYHHLFEHSGRNHAFPLIAAHGALWARGYFRFGMRLGAALSLQHAFSPEVRRRRLAQLAAFADALRDVNRRVCVETYTTYHFTARFGDHPDCSEFVPAELLPSLCRMHGARRSGREMTTSEKRRVFEDFFLNEQATVVGPSIEAAAAAFDWPLMKFLALQPVLRFAYFPKRRTFWFRNFADQEERIERGLCAFDLAAAAGWKNVEAALRQYAILPAAFFEGSARHFATVRQSVLSSV